MAPESNGTPQISTRGAGGAHRMLILAEDVIGDESLVHEIVRHAAGRAVEVRIVAPPRVKSPLALAAGDVDDDIEGARRRLSASLTALRRSGIEATGNVGEADPALALEDGLRIFPADEVIVVARAGQRRTWLEDDFLARVRREVDLPVTVAEVEPTDGGGSHLAGTPRRFEPDAAPLSDEDYLPPMSLRDKVALLVGILGTIALGIASIACASNQSSGHSGPNLDAGTGTCAVPIGLAIGAFIVTVFHGAALLLMRGDEYRGRWERLTAYSLIAGIPPAVIVGVIFA
jgi:hypothetical protein